MMCELPVTVTIYYEGLIQRMMEMVEIPPTVGINRLVVEGGGINTCCLYPVTMNQ